MNNKRTDKEKIFKEINKLKYDNVMKLKDYMISQKYTLLDVVIVSIVSKMFLKYRHEDFHFEEVDLNTIRKCIVSYVHLYKTREEEYELMMNNDEEYLKYFSTVLDENRLIRTCKDTSKNSLDRDIYKSLTFVDKYLSQKKTSDINHNYDFNKDEDFSFIKNEISSEEIQYYLDLD